MLVMDVDGTLTNAKVYYSGNGEELKEFSIRDGMGIVLLKIAGIIPAIITSENSKIVSARAAKLKIRNIVLGSRNKKKDLIDLSGKLKLSLENVAYIGDDVNDLHAIEISGVSACPSDAIESVKKKVNYVCKNSGGNGAVREFIDRILKSQNKSLLLNENW
ncbi:MAG: HAD-IIIA family hydrolase [Bacteroidetes bacterium]|nr:MAG: HAD-IIIA family hydrolase [Bacteroidota bacterium]